MLEDHEARNDASVGRADLDPVPKRLHRWSGRLGETRIVDELKPPSACKGALCQGFDIGPLNRGIIGLPIPRCRKPVGPLLCISQHGDAPVSIFSHVLLALAEKGQLHALELVIRELAAPEGIYLGPDRVIGPARRRGGDRLSREMELRNYGARISKTQEEPRHQ